MIALELLYYSYWLKKIIATLFTHFYTFQWYDKWEIKSFTFYFSDRAASTAMPCPVSSKRKRIVTCSHHVHAQAIPYAYNEWLSLPLFHITHIVTWFLDYMSTQLALTQRFISFNLSDSNHGSFLSAIRSINTWHCL